MRRSFIALLILLTGCAISPVKRYRTIIDPLVGKSKQDEVNQVLGKPVFCIQEQTLQRCEYRTTAARNEETPYMHHKEIGFGPDLSPYDSFDVLDLYYDAFGVLKEWNPVVVQP